ncbi:hypothetical protein BGZ95_011903 [Linnemannia exigua]|uniref:Uncharacterized protein n=1 Tax=Linnemannia exigua TaxID=604196 RepID=A0AAD4H4V3_9FUNG|nr:hypothetical protein BGZ95_011903 [Linnemannia exigua]
MTHLDFDDVDYHSTRVIRDLCRTTSQLKCLKTLRLSASHHEPIRDLGRVFRSFLKHAPALEGLYFPPLDEISDDMELALASIGKMCPQIPDPKQLKRLKGLRYTYTYENPRFMIDTWIRHSAALRQFELSNANRVNSTVIQAALTTLRALEVFRVKDRGGSSSIWLWLEHAVESDWVCSSLHHFEFLISITPASDSPAYLKDHRKASWTGDNHCHWEVLGKFYSQIASLTRPEHSF